MDDCRTSRKGCCGWRREASSVISRPTDSTRLYPTSRRAFRGFAMNVICTVHSSCFRRNDTGASATVWRQCNTHPYRQWLYFQIEHANWTCGKPAVYAFYIFEVFDMVSLRHNSLKFCHQSCGKQSAKVFFKYPSEFIFLIGILNDLTLLMKARKRDCCKVETLSQVRLKYTRRYSDA